MAAAARLPAACCSRSLQSSNSSSGSTSGNTGSGPTGPRPPLLPPGRRHERAGRGGQEGRHAQRHHAACQLGNYGTIMKDFTAKYGIQDLTTRPRLQPGRAQRRQPAQGPGPRAGRARHGHRVRGQGRPAGHPRPVQGGELGQHPLTPRPPTAPGSPTTAATWPSGTISDKVRPRPTRSRTCSSPSTEPGRHQRHRDPGQRRVLGRVRLGPWPTAGSLDNITPGVSYFRSCIPWATVVPVTASAGDNGERPGHRSFVWWISCSRPRSGRASRASRS